MANKIDSRAMVAASAKIAQGVKIGPYVIVSEKAEIGTGTILEPFSQVLGHTKIGANCHIFSNAIVGSIPQDLKYKGEESYLVIGENNRIREFVTINPGTKKGDKTIIGNNNLIMAYSHIAHDCFIGDYNVLANSATLAGHVEIGNHAVIGGLVAVHQFCRIGDYSIVGGCSKVVQDIPPYSMSDGHPAVVRALNLVGLKRKDFSPEDIIALRRAFKALFFANHSFEQAKKIVFESMGPSQPVKNLLDFIAASQRGVSRR